MYRFCWLVYGNATALVFGDSTIWSEEGHSRVTYWAHFSSA